jgi:vancomycin resistance protein VanW
MPAELQRGKEINVALAARAIDGVRIEPGACFSYHRLVGRPSRGRGFRLGLELQDQRESVGIGGGCCQVSNLLYWLAVNAGLAIAERHRHGFDLFPDHQRSVPFGCGATVFYNYRDLRFSNPLDQPVRVSLRILDLPPAGSDRPARGWRLVGRICAQRDPGRRVVVEERDHRFFVEGGRRMRENRIFRRIVDRDGSLIEDALLAHNRCEVRY